MSVRERQGFTLIELMIVIAIIAIIAAIAIPGLLTSQRAANERNAASSLKTISSAEADFRGNDRDGNKIQDYWTGDVAGLYGVVPTGSTEMIKLIEISVAGADWASVGTFALGNTGLCPIDRSTYMVPSPKAGFWYQVLTTDDGGSPYQVNTNGAIDTAGSIAENAWWNHAKFAFCAFPDSFAAGRNVFFVNEGNTILKRPMNGPVKDPTATPTGTPITLSTGASHLVGTQAAEVWPQDSALRLFYTKID